MSGMITGQDADLYKENQTLPAYLLLEQELRCLRRALPFAKGIDLQNITLRIARAEENQTRLRQPQTRPVNAITRTVPKGGWLQRLRRYLPRRSEIAMAA